MDQSSCAVGSDFNGLPRSAARMAWRSSHDTPEGYVNEDVFAHSNRHGDVRGLVIYHNKSAETRDWVKTSAAYMDKASGQLVQKFLGVGLALPKGGYAIFKDYTTQLEYIRPCNELWEKGLYVDLGSYQRHVFLDWRFVDEDEHWKTVNQELNGAGVQSVQSKWDEFFLVKEVVEEKPKTKRLKKRTEEDPKITRKRGKGTPKTYKR